ncbi:hypothetical protein GY45DRAFT_23288 [Cubamyces sp. BRFM 1775]|nr:hypothetical protein GY45DRAFT_23288 [Cubamyces sp. BRFM 1775]
MSCFDGMLLPFPRTRPTPSFSPPVSQPPGPLCPPWPTSPATRPALRHNVSAPLRSRPPPRPFCFRGPGRSLGLPATAGSPPPPFGPFWPLIRLSLRYSIGGDATLGLSLASLVSRQAHVAH